MQGREWYVLMARVKVDVNHGREKRVKINV